MHNFNEFLNESFLPVDQQEKVNEFDRKEKNILSWVKEIIMTEEGISEKNFSYINAMNQSFDKFMPTIRSKHEYHEDIKSFDGKRKQYAAEFMYDKYFAGKFNIEQA